MVAVLRAPGAARGLSYIWSSDTDAVVEVGVHKWRAEADLEITGTILVCADPPVGADLVCDLQLLPGFTSLYATNPADRPRIVAGQTEGGGAAPASAVILAGQEVVPATTAIGVGPSPGTKPDLRVFYKLL